MEALGKAITTTTLKGAELQKAGAYTGLLTLVCVTSGSIF